MEKQKIYNIDNNKLIFEGNILKGVRNGKEKEYDYYGGLILMDEYENADRNGKGKEYYESGT